MSNLLQSISPVNNAVFAERPWATYAEIESTLALAQKEQQAWKQTALAERQAACRRAVQYFLDHADEIADELTWQMGRPIRYTPFEINRGFRERANFMIEAAEQALADLEIEKSGSFQRFIRREALGTVLVLAPWNYPYLTSVNVVIPAILAGNSVILKHATQTPLCAERYAAAFEAAGLPEGVFQFLHLTHEKVEAVIGDRRIAHVAFTGSVEGGKAVQNAVNQRFLAAGL
ncbi:MAG: aldehyde dehydrogenase family protein, partial [Bacteroidota bacterium]